MLVTSSTTAIALSVLLSCISISSSGVGGKNGEISSESMAVTVDNLFNLCSGLQGSSNN